MGSSKANDKSLSKVITSLDKVPQSTKEMVFEMAQTMSEMEIIRYFNQQALDMFNLVSTIAKRIGKEREINVVGYKSFFDNALKINAKLPIDKFTLMILEYAAEIYEENEDCFLEMTIPDTEVNVGNEFGLIRSDMFKKLWVILGSADKKLLKENVILLTTYAHVYLYKTLLIRG